MAGTVNGGSATAIGGVVGINYGTVKTSYNTGSVSGSSGSTMVGGVVGCSAGTVQTSYNTGRVSGSTKVGGVVGYNCSPANTITSTYYNSTVFTGPGIGGGIRGSGNRPAGGDRNRPAWKHRFLFGDRVDLRLRLERERFFDPRHLDHGNRLSKRGTDRNHRPDPGARPPGRHSDFRKFRLQRTGSFAHPKRHYGRNGNVREPECGDIRTHFALSPYNPDERGKF